MDIKVNNIQKYVLLGAIAIATAVYLFEVNLEEGLDDILACASMVVVILMMLFAVYKRVKKIRNDSDQQTLDYLIWFNIKQILDSLNNEERFIHKFQILMS